MAYTHFRMLAYEVPTVLLNPETHEYVSAWTPGEARRTVPLVPVPLPLPAMPKPAIGAPLPDARKGLPEDAYIRMLRLASVVEQTRHRLALRPPPGVLNVFVVPEFYFRPPALGRELYHGDTYPLQSSNTIFTALHSMFKGEAFRDWLFVLGTVLWNNDYADRASAPGAGTPRKEVHYSNTAVVVTGGPQGEQFLVEKKVPSHIDGIPEIEYLPGVPESAGPTNDPGLKPVFEQWHVRKGHVIDANGVSVGVEVCLDHHKQVLRHVVEDWKRFEFPPKLRGVQLQILTAGGMVAQADAVAARTGGYVLRNDGAGSGGHASELWRIEGWRDGRRGPTVGGAVDHVTRIKPEEFVPIIKRLTKSDWRHVPQGLMALVDEQRVAIYPVEALPA